MILRNVFMMLYNLSVVVLSAIRGLCLVWVLSVMLHRRFIVVLLKMDCGADALPWFGSTMDANRTARGACADWRRECCHSCQRSRERGHSRIGGVSERLDFGFHDACEWRESRVRERGGATRDLAEAHPILLFRGIPWP